MKYWYGDTALFYLRPFSRLFQLIVRFRRWLYRQGYKKVIRFNVPVIIVGNITVGGTGKTPLVIRLAQFLKQQGFHPGIVSRGYGGKAASYPQLVDVDSDPDIVSEEAILLFQRTGCPVVVDPNRVAAVKSLLARYACDVVIGDDGLQHYALGRDIEIAVLDGERRLGNGWCLPAGPLREPSKRLEEVDFIVSNGLAKGAEYSMQLVPMDLVNLADLHRAQHASLFQGQTIQAVAGIGHPQRFFDTLRCLGLSIVEHAFPDHYLFQSQDLAFADQDVVIMTEKDAVKCRRFAKDNYWYLPVNVQLQESFTEKLLEKLRNSPYS